jgi:hypothetical protein
MHAVKGSPVKCHLPVLSRTFRFWRGLVMKWLIAIQLWIVLTVTAPPGAGTPSAMQRPPHPIFDYKYLLFADLVIRGEVLDAHADLVPWREAENDSDIVRTFIKAFFVTVAVEEVMKGYEDADTLTFTVTDPEDPPWVGPEARIVAGLWATCAVPGYTYELKSGGIYGFYQGSWMTLKPAAVGRRHALRELRDKIAAVSLDSLSQSADAVFLGAVEDVEKSEFWDESQGIYGRVWKISLAVDTRVFGEVPDTVTITGVMAGNYLPEWRYEMPKRILPGDTFCVFAKEIDGVVIALGGMNGFLRVDGGRLLYDSRVELPYPPAEWVARVRQAAGR